MPGMAERYHELAPGAYLTLMSMIEAIALENLVSRGQEIGAASNFGAESVAVWLAWLLTLQVIIWTWVTNAQGFMSFRWTADIGDFLLPFGGGLIQFIAIGWIGEATLGRFMILIGFLALGLIAILKWIFSSENETAAEFSEKIWKAGLYACVSLGAVLGLMGGLLVLLGILGSLYISAVLALWNLLFVGMFWIWIRAWLECVAPNPATSNGVSRQKQLDNQ